MCAVSPQVPQCTWGDQYFPWSNVVDLHHLLVHWLRRHGPSHLLWEGGLPADRNHGETHDNEYPIYIKEWSKGFVLKCIKSDNALAVPKVFTVLHPLTRWWRRLPCMAPNYPSGAWFVAQGHFGTISNPLLATLPTELCRTQNWENLIFFNNFITDIFFLKYMYIWSIWN